MQLGTDFAFRRLSDADVTKKFKTGDEAFQPLKSFLNNQALEFQKALIAQTFVCSPLNDGNDAQQVIAFITLTCSEIDIRAGIDLADCPKAQKYDSMPALKIARLAVDCRYRDRDIGSLLIAFALASAFDDIAPVAGCRFLVTDAKRQAIDFYHKQGFTLLDTDENHKAEAPIMFMDLFKNL